MGVVHGLRSAKGSSQLSLQGVARGGLAVELKLEYKIESVGKGRLCISCTRGKNTTIDIRAQGCVGVYHGWPNNQVKLYAWYQLRRVKICSKKIWGKRFVS